MLPGFNTGLGHSSLMQFPLDFCFVLLCLKESRDECAHSILR